MRCFHWSIGCYLALSFILVSCAGLPTATSPQALALENSCVQSLQAGDYTGAATRCQLCLEYDEAVPECINGLGLVAFAQGDNDTAIKQFSKAISMSKTFGQARNNLGAVYFKMGNYTEALPLFEAATKIDPGYTDARYNTGLCYLNMGQQSTAAKDTKSALNYYSLALGQYEKLVVINPQYASGYRDQGLIMTYEAALESDPKTQADDINKANGFFQQCLQVDPSNETCHQSYGNTLLYQKQYDDALFQFVQCLAEDKTNSVCISGASAAYQGSEFNGQALGSFAQLLKANPDDPNGHYGYCVALFTKSMNDDAISECNTALQLNPNLCNAYYQLGMYYKKVLNSAQALTNCRSYLLCDQNQTVPAQVTACQKVVTTLSGQ